MKKSFVYLLLFNLIILLAGCTHRAPEVVMKSFEFIDRLAVNGVTYVYKGREILSLEMDFYFKENLAPNFEVNTKEHRAQIYKRIIGGAKLYIDGEEKDSIYGYWPEKSGETYAKSMTIFYVVPKDRTKSVIKFSYDGAFLGYTDYHFDYIIK